MVYNDVKRFGLIGIIPAPKTKSGAYGKNNQSVRKKVAESIKSNKEFVQFALEDGNVDHINMILGKLIEFVIKCNEAHYYFNREK